MVSFASCSCDYVVKMLGCFISINQWAAFYSYKSLQWQSWISDGEICDASVSLIISSLQMSGGGREGEQWGVIRSNNKDEEDWCDDPCIQHL